jgi:ribosomal protein L21E
VHSCPRDWHKWLSLAEYWYNTSYHTTLGTTLFEVLYGHPPRHFGIANPVDCTVPDLADWLQNRSLLTKLIQQQLLRAQQRMKAQADAKRSEREFQVGDMVYLKLQPHILSSVASRSNQKLAFKYYGPFKVLQRVGAVAYKLALPDHAKIHLVIHVSQLKKHIAPSEAVSTDLSTVCVDPTVLPVPMAVIQRAYKGKGGRMAMRTLVQWNSPSQLQTWEDEHDLRRRFPSAPAWGQAVFQVGGTVMNNKSMKRERRLLEHRARRMEQKRTSADMVREE